MFTDYYASPFGTLEICADPNYIHAIHLINTISQPGSPNKLTELAKHLLEEYFNGNNPIIHPSLFFLNGTTFQKSVWSELMKIPYGSTTSYSDIARRTGNPKAVRAVGTAIGKNPVCILIPCHRVITFTGKIGNYAYGPDMKKCLLLLEKKIIQL